MRLQKSFTLSPRLSGLIAAALVTVGLMTMSWGLGVSAGRPISTRTDLFFQSDAGGLVTDAATDFKSRNRGVHPLLYFVWTKPLYLLAKALEPTIPMQTTAVVGSRLLVSTSAGLGVGMLVVGLVRRGITPRILLAIAPLYLLGSGQAMAAMPDHFGISQGVLAAAFGTYLAPGSFRRGVLLLGILSVLATGVTVSNFLFPFALLVAHVVQNYRDRAKWWWYAIVIGVCIAIAASGLLVLIVADGLRERFLMRVEGYLTWRITKDPVGALQFAFRGVIDSVVAPTPSITRDNLDRVPMLTYQPSGGSYSVWPYDWRQSIGASLWLGLLAFGTVRAIRGKEFRIPAIALGAWILWNAIFHNIWGDEYFLYTPHYSWALITLVSLGLASMKSRWVWPITLAISLTCIHTLLQYRDAIASIAE